MNTISPVALYAMLGGKTSTDSAEQTKASQSFEELLNNIEAEESETDSGLSDINEDSALWSMLASAMGLITNSAVLSGGENESAASAEQATGVSAVTTDLNTAIETLDIGINQTQIAAIGELDTGVTSEAGAVNQAAQLPGSTEELLLDTSLGSVSSGDSISTADSSTVVENLLSAIKNTIVSSGEAVRAEETSNTAIDAASANIAENTASSTVKAAAAVSLEDSPDAIVQADDTGAVAAAITPVTDKNAVTLVAASLNTDSSEPAAQLSVTLTKDTIVVESDENADTSGAKADTGFAAVITGSKGNNSDSGQSEDSGTQQGLLKELKTVQQDKTAEVSDSYITSGAENQTSTQYTDKISSVENAIDTIVNDITSMRTNEKKELEIQLEPESLGKLSISLSMGENGLTAQIRTGDSEIKSIIAGQINMLVDSLKNSGISVQNIDVVYTSAGQQDISQSGSQSYNAYQNQNTSKISMSELIPIEELDTAYTYTDSQQINSVDYRA